MKYRLPSMLGIASLIAACSSTPPAESPASQSAPPRAEATASAPAIATAAKRSELDDPNSPLAKRSIYFPYDNFVVDNKYQGLVAAHAHYLSQHAEAQMAVEGNADERGSTEYNLALGQKRAEAVKRMLKLNGVAESKIEAISYGKERPKAECHEERCWQENRRADLVYGATKK